MSDDETVCRRCGAFGDLPHERVDGDCALPHRRHSRKLVDGGRVCVWHTEEWAEWLGDIPDLYGTLSHVLYAGSVPDDTAAHSHQKVSGSPSPIRLNAWALWRNEVTDHVTDRDGAQHSTYLGGHLPDLAAVLSGWEQAVRDDMGWTSTASGTVAGAAAFLTAHLPAAAALPDVEEFHVELRWVRAALQAAHGITDPSPLFACLGVPCGGNVWPMPAGSPACDRCGRRYGTLDYVRAKGDGLRERTSGLRSLRAGVGGRP